VISELRAQSVDGIVLGCTEIPPLLGDAAVDPDLLDPLPLLAEAAVRRALADG
jgi:aspartate racemase